MPLIIPLFSPPQRLSLSTISPCPGRRFTVTQRNMLHAGKAAKFLGKLGRRVARTPKHGGGGTVDGAPTPLIHDAHGGAGG